MTPISISKPGNERSAGGYAATAMRAIRVLQEQMKEIGKRLQNEITHPTLSGSEQQQLMRDLAQQMSSIRSELEALQESIIQHDSMAAFKKEQRANPAAPGAGDQDSPLTVAQGATPASDTATQTPKPGKGHVQMPGQLGTFIDTQA